VGIAALQESGEKITAESIKRITHELEPGFAGLSFQVIRRNPRAYALYRAVANAFTEEHSSVSKKPVRRGLTRRRRRASRAPYDLLQRLEKRDLVRRVRALEMELNAERNARAHHAYDEQALLAKILRLETEMILIRADAGNGQ
jgi:hypothetical protein